MSDNLLREQLREALDALGERESRVLRLRYGLDGGDPQTLEEVGKVFGVTRERVRQIEARAIRKLRQPASLAPAAGTTWIDRITGLTGSSGQRAPPG